MLNLGLLCFIYRHSMLVDYFYSTFRGRLRCKAKAAVRFLSWNRKKTV